jgi:glucose-6-phosphate-specific signal transduction histidine kinase
VAEGWLARQQWLDGSPEIVADGVGAGAGLGGLADRVRAVGGTLEVGRADGGGFRLQVRLVVPAPAGVGAEGVG